MADLNEMFEKAQKNVKKLTSRPTNEDLLALYANFKQATVGDANGKRPGFTDMKGRAKFDAWAKLKGTEAKAAMQRYVDKVEKLLGG